VKILALDTSSEHCSAALWADGEIDARDTPAGQNHSSVLLRMIDELLRARALRLRDVDAIAYGEGPGSFTGLRIACGVVQGLAFGATVPVIGVGTLLAMAEGTGAERVVCCVDARIKEIYHAAYSRTMDLVEVPAAPLLRGGRTEGNPLPGAHYREGSGKRTGGTQGSPRYPLPSVQNRRWEVVCEPALCAPGAAPVLDGDGWIGCGSGFNAYPAALEARYRGQLARIEPGRYPHARDIAALAVPRVERGEVFSAEAAAPVYLRNKVALRTDERPGR
jgi:tRNA threonylcarbamoyladenosine biosynthesis protein TsaB